MGASLQDYAMLPLPLTAMEAAELHECEVTIVQGLKTFYDVGNALGKINRKKLYRAEYPTFEAYCTVKWGMSRPRAYQLIDASDIQDNLSTIVDTLPDNEAQIRALKAAPPDKQAEIWEKAQATAFNGNVTARHITEVIQTEIPMPEPEPEPAPGATPKQVSVFIPPPEPKPLIQHTRAPIWKIEAQIKSWLADYPFKSVESAVFYLARIKYRAFAWSNLLLTIKEALADLPSCDGDQHQAINNILDQMQYANRLQIGPVKGGWTCSGCDKHLIDGWQLKYASGKLLCMACLENITPDAPAHEEIDPDVRRLLGQADPENKTDFGKTYCLACHRESPDTLCPTCKQERTGWTGNQATNERAPVEIVHMCNFCGETFPVAQVYSHIYNDGTERHHICRACASKALHALCDPSDPDDITNTHEEEFMLSRMRDRDKVMRAGLRLFRALDIPLTNGTRTIELKEYSPSGTKDAPPGVGSWKTFETFPTRAAMRRRVAELDHDKQCLFEERV